MYGIQEVVIAFVDALALKDCQDHFVASMPSSSIASMTCSTILHHCFHGRKGPYQIVMTSATFGFRHVLLVNYFVIESARAARKKSRTKPSPF